MLPTELWFLLPLLTLLGGLCALAPLGVQVLRRGVIFIDLAVAQAAAASTLWLQVFHHTHEPLILISASIFGALVCAAFVALVSQAWTERREALIGLVYVLSAAVALMAAQFNPHGPDDLQQLLASDLLWSDSTDASLAAMSGAVILLIQWLRRSWLSNNYFFYSAFAVVTSILVQSLGVFLVFVLLIGPALLLDRIGIFKSSLIVLFAIATGLLGSWHFDLPSGVCMSLSLAAFTLIASLRTR